MMKRGSKRSNLSISSSIAADSSILRSKRVMDAPSFNVNRAESSRQHLMEATHLDVKRAESAQQHVRALNTQFASWVQLQLQNHPDELWEDGLRDYLSHASHIMEKFKDVVDWLRANAAKAGGAPAAGSPSDQKDLVSLSENSSPNFNSEIANGISQESKLAKISSLPNSGLSNSSSSGLFSFSQTPASSSSLQSSALFGSQRLGLFSTDQALASSSSVQSTGGINSQSSGFFSTGRLPASSASVQTSGLFGAKSSGFFVHNQTPASSSGFQSSGLFNSQSSGIFANNRTPTTSSFANNQTPVSSSSLENSGLFSSQSSDFFANNKKPAFPGSQIFMPPKVETSGDLVEGDELEQPSSPSLKKSEEKGVIVVHEIKCKVYVKPDNPEDKGWKDMGMGQLSVKCKEGVDKATKESKPTIVIRNEVGKILLNALIYPGIKMNIKKNTITSIFHTLGSGHADGAEASKSDVVARTYLLKLKSEEETLKLASIIKQYAPST